MKAPSPRASRPGPAGYFLPADQGGGLLDWGETVARLSSARNYWVASCGPDGRPHSMPVWGIWLDDRFVFSTSPASRKARNLAANPHAVLHLESGAQVIVLECRAAQVGDAADLAAFLRTYNAKYDWNFTVRDVENGGVYELRPLKAFAWMGDQGEAFSGTATRWLF